MQESEVKFLVTLRTSEVNDLLDSKRRKVIERKLELEFGDGKIDVEVFDG
jgi:hypothetical protein